MKNRIVLSKILFSASVFIVIAVCGCSGSKFTSSEVTEDLVFLKEKIGSVHPNPYYSLSQQDFVHSIDSLIEALSHKNKVSQKEVFCMLNPVVASLHDAHTRLILPNKILLRSFLWGSKVIPIDVSIDNGKIYVNNNVSKTVIEPGSEIISINDVPASELLNTIKRNKYGDSDAMRSYGINNKTFPRELWLYLGFNKHFSLRVISLGGVENLVSLKGIYQPSFYKRIGKLYPHKPTKLIDGDNGYYYTLQGDSVGIINYSSFGGDRDSSFFSNVFARAHVAGVKHLFLDLRGNGGGSTNTYRHIVSYLTDDTLKMFSNIEYKVSDDLLKGKIFGDNFPYADDSMDSMVSIDKSLFDIVPYNTDVRYDGAFYCVSDVGTYSTASGFCALIQDNSLGKLVGEPTGGMGASFGNFVLVELPNAKLKCAISTTFYVRGNGDTRFKPIIPDYYIDVKKEPSNDWCEVVDCERVK